MKLKFWHIVVGVLIVLVLVYKCNKCFGPEPPSHKDDKKQVDSILLESNWLAKTLSDSIESLNAELSIKRDQELILINDRDILLSEIDALSKKIKPDIEKIRASKDTAQIVSDCNDILKDFEAYILATDREIHNCDTTLKIKSDQVRILNEETQQLAMSNEAYLNMVSAISGKYDVLYADYRKYSKRRGQVFAGVDFMGGLDKPFYVGLSGGLKTKGNKFFSIAALIGNDPLRTSNLAVIDNLYFHASAKFLISFRKK